MRRHLSVNTTWSRCRTSDGKEVGHQNAFGVIRSRLLHVLLRYLFRRLSPLEGDRGRLIAAYAPPRFVLTPLMFKSLFCTPPLWSKDEMLNPAPILIIKISLLYSLPFFSEAHLPGLTFRCQNSPLPALEKKKKLWWRISRGWAFTLFSLENKESDQEVGTASGLSIIIRQERRKRAPSGPAAVPSCHCDNDIEAGIINFMVC